MFLDTIRVSNFRGLREAELSLDETVVLIGENDCGKSSLLEALALALKPVPVGKVIELKPHHFHSEFAERSDAEIRICLLYRERHPGEWSHPQYGALSAIAGSESVSRRELELEIVASRTTNELEYNAEWEVKSGWRRFTQADRPDFLDWLRSMNPLIWLREGLVASHSDYLHNHRLRGSALPNQKSPSTELMALIEGHYKELVGGTRTYTPDDLETGFRAAQLMLERARDHISSPRQCSTWLLSELAFRKERIDQYSPASHVPGTAAHKLGLLLLIGAILQHGKPGMPIGAEPIAVIENPEAHLHPITLATVCSLIDRIKWQKIITTHSGSVLTAASLQGIRRVTRKNGLMRVFQVRQGSLTRDDTRRVRYHLRSRRGGAMFARCWLLVEGETEFWILPELARILGHELSSEGIACVEFAQCGLAPLIKLSSEFGIEWHLLADGDSAGRGYAGAASQFFPQSQREERLTILRESDIEHCFWAHGYSRVFQEIAYPSSESVGRASRTIERAIKKTSKPNCALRLVEAVAARNSPGVPPPLRRAIEMCVRLARVREPLADALKERFIHSESFHDGREDYVRETHASN